LKYGVHAIAAGGDAHRMGDGLAYISISLREKYGNHLNSSHQLQRYMWSYVNPKERNMMNIICRCLHASRIYQGIIVCSFKERESDLRAF
jgi:hypothetical protein